LNTIEILSWNILHGGGSRLQKILEAISVVDADIIALCEFRNHKKTLDQLSNLGYVNQYYTAASSTKNSVAIFSKIPGKVNFHEKADPNFPHSIISTEFDDFELYSIYLPHKKKHIFFDYLIDKCTNQTKPIILTGDFNTGINKVDQKGQSFMYESSFKQLLQIHMGDAFRHIHQDKKVYSWYSPQGNGFRYDHTLMSTSLLPLIKSFQYLEILSALELSDHAPMHFIIGE